MFLDKVLQAVPMVRELHVISDNHETDNTKRGQFEYFNWTLDFTKTSFLWLISVAGLIDRLRGRRLQHSVDYSVSEWKAVIGRSFAEQNRREARLFRWAVYAERFYAARM